MWWSVHACYVRSDVGCERLRYQKRESRLLKKRRKLGFRRVPAPEENARVAGFEHRVKAGGGTCSPLLTRPAFGPLLHTSVHSSVHCSIHRSIHRSIGPFFGPLLHTSVPSSVDWSILWSIHHMVEAALHSTLCHPAPTTVNVSDRMRRAYAVQ